MLATLNDLETRLGRTLDEAADVERAQAALDDASVLVVHETGRDDWDTATVPAVVQTVILASARRRFTNPDELVNETDAVGPFNQARQRAAAAVGAYLTDAEKAIVRRYRQGGAGNGLWTQRTTRGHEWEATVWASGFGSEPFPVDTRGEYGQ